MKILMLRYTSKAFYQLEKKDLSTILPYINTIMYPDQKEFVTHSDLDAYWMTTKILNDIKKFLVSRNLDIDKYVVGYHKGSSRPHIHIIIGYNGEGKVINNFRENFKYFYEKRLKGIWVDRYNREYASFKECDDPDSAEKPYQYALKEGYCVATNFSCKDIERITTVGNALYVEAKAKREQYLQKEEDKTSKSRLIVSYMDELHIKGVDWRTVQTKTFNKFADSDLSPRFVCSTIELWLYKTSYEWREIYLEKKMLI